jgi:TonB family protein
LPTLLIAAAAAAAAMFVPNANVRMATMVQRDYPDALKRAGKQGAVMQQILVSPDGRAISCEAVQTIGDPLFAGASCKSFRSWRFDPPRGAAGEPIHALIQPTAVFTIRGASELGDLRRPPEIELQARGLQESARQLLNVHIGADGHIQHCGSANGASSPLVTAACGAADDATWDIIHSGDGDAVPYVRQLKVQFQPEGGQPTDPPSI